MEKEVHKTGHKLKVTYKKLGQLIDRNKKQANMFMDIKLILCPTILQMFANLFQKV